MYIINIIDTITQSDGVFMILVIILVAVSLAMAYLIYSQNREMKELAKQNSLFNSESKKVNSEEKLADDQEKIVDNDIDGVGNKTKLVALTDEKIPDKLDYTQALWQKDDFDLLRLSKELESLPRDRKVNLTPYEEEQEEKAIISYDELVNQKNDNDILIKKVSLNDEANCIDDFDDDSLINDDYKHEEEYLKSLKELKQILN